MSGDLARAHAPRVHRDDLVVEAREAGLPFGYDLRFKRPIAIPRRLERQLAEIAFQGLGGLAVTRVAAVVAGLVVFRIPEMIGHLGLHGPLQQRFCELLQQPVFANDVFWLLIIRQQFVNEVEVDGHRVSLVSFFRWPFTQCNLHPRLSRTTPSIVAASSAKTTSTSIFPPSPMLSCWVEMSSPLERIAFTISSA